MKALPARVTRGLNIGSICVASDNSGARLVRIVGVKKGKAERELSNMLNLETWLKFLLELESQI